MSDKEDLSKEIINKKGKVGFNKACEEMGGEVSPVSGRDMKVCVIKKMDSAIMEDGTVVPYGKPKK